MCILSSETDDLIHTNDSFIHTQKAFKTKKVLSLFSGCGGMDIGFEGNFKCLKRSMNPIMHPDWIKEDLGEWVQVCGTGFQTVFANDIRPDAKSAWASYFKNKYENANEIFHLESIVDLVKRAKMGETVFPQSVDVVTGGFPCQDFSVAGKRQGFHSKKSHTGQTIKAEEPSIENRGQLYIWMKEVITLTKPLVFIAENVKGLTHLEDVKETIEADFAHSANGGYLVIPAIVLNAADYGVPQSRERVIFYGFRKNALKPEALHALSQKKIPTEYNPYPLKTHGYTIQHPLLNKFVTCQEALTGLKEPNESNDISQQKYSKAKYMGKHCQGQKEIQLDLVAPTIRSEHHGNIEFRRLSVENGGKHLTELKNGLEQRRLTIRECARIQTFPDDYQFILSKNNTTASVTASNAYKMIGNAVPCVLGYHIAMRLVQLWHLLFKEQ